MLSFVGIGWSKRLRKGRENYTLSLAKELILRNALRGGQELYYFLVRYGGRNAVIIFLDGKDFTVKDELQMDLKKFVLK